MIYPAAFKAWIKIMAKWEGGFNHRPYNEDRGGATNRGVTFGAWVGGGAKVVNKPATLEGLKSLTAAEAEKIAFVMFWKFYKIDTIRNEGAQILAADAVWHSGGYGFKSLTKSKAKNAAQLNNLLSQGLNIKQMAANRVAWLKTLSNAPANPGWWPRMADGLKTAQAFNKNFIPLAGLLFLAGLSTLVYAKQI